ncbi:hypothetical protein [Bacteroides thetaiotaomicron]|uniref:hypothetical protein n=1 Tax=Bacteroides thetaiotaomicron TaxID=818 RepID=UPI0039C294AC
MDAIGLNPIKLDAIGLDPIRMNAIRLGVPGASFGSGRPYIDSELLNHVKMAIFTWGKSNDDPDRTVLKDLSGNGNDMRLLNFGFTEGSGYGLPGTDFEGWLCTDGVDDIIESVKPVSEMLEGSNEITVVSIIHGIGSKNAYTNVLRESPSNYIRNTSTADGKTGIYGYTCKDTTKSIITDILGDKNDYKLEYIQTTTPSTVNSVFSVAGWRENNGSMIVYPVAYAGGFIANKVLTTDEINQIIAYFNLDRPGQIIKPQLYCNIKKQGITNDNHAEFNDQLIDFVGGHNIQLNNISWEGESGINSYPVVFGANKTWNVIRANDGIDWRYTLLANKITIYKIETSNKSLIYSYVHTASGSNSMTVPAFKIKVDGLKAEESIIYDYISSDNTARSSRIIIRDNGLYDLPVSVPIQVTEITPALVLIGFTIALNDNVSKEGLTIEVLPTIENALCLDGISDFGKATGLPVLKDYTVVADREIKKSTGGVVSKNTPNGAFVCEVTGEAYSYGAATAVSIDYKRKISYQSKYIYNGSPIRLGTGVDSDSMWLGTVRNGDPKFSKLALWSLMLFPYSLSEFLLERQLRKYKAGTLYPDMVEFRPVIKSNVPYSSISYSVNPGMYVTEGSTVTITITLSNETDKLVGVSSNSISDISISGGDGIYEITGKVTKSPQKINIIISSYLTTLGNETLISNETLIKNE